ncbi:TetR/AcrR family transcriptional regulator [Prevotella sp. 10(H)]|uniref:TetR/AcrR family transcriptional regulator n=1 Tax=Prevotella sp. 10(H) TaxID=1158294 RepID=UPI0004A73F76|nr:TetR/AcrR family transcriptional regulator [Prevotella sp. 10(H)]
MKETRDYILKKSFQLFLQKSFKEVTMKEIVDKTGLSKGAFYHYFESKEAVFEEVVKYFYNHEIITDYSGFPTTSLKDFYHTYLDRLNQPSDEIDDLGDNEANLFVFISEASRKVPRFTEIHNAQRKKELQAWSSAVFRAKKNKEIKSALPDEDIARMFIYLSDGVSLSTISHKPNEETLSELKRSWDNLYKLLVGWGLSVY